MSDWRKTLQRIRKTGVSYEWRRKVKKRDGKCMRCGSTSNLEVHHITPLSFYIEKYNIDSIQKSIQYKSELWNVSNGITLCNTCHKKEHEKD